MIQLGILGYNYRLLWGCNGDNYTIISLYDFNYIIMSTRETYHAGNVFPAERRYPWASRPSPPLHWWRPPLEQHWRLSQEP